MTDATPISEAPALGAKPLGEGFTRFCVWAPKADDVAVHIVAPFDKYLKLAPLDKGYFAGEVKGMPADARYVYQLNGSLERPDPASGYQPRGVHGPSSLVDHGFAWTDDKWMGLALHDFIFYELHIGTFTAEGTFDAAIAELDRLVDLGITAIEIMPVAQFPGERNWGYDGVYPFAVQNSYGGPGGLKRLVNACHEKGLAVVLDVVYNHLGPEGNYLHDFGFYFSREYRTPWGEHINFDGPHSDEVRRYFIENALQWFTCYHIDALRLDAVHAILDFSATPFIADLALTVAELNRTMDRRVYLFPESAANDARLITSPELGGIGLDAQWNDDFHHALHGVLTGEQNGYYKDFGHIDHMAKAVEKGFVYDGLYSEFRQRRHGNDARSLPGEHFIVFSQNHDQVGNRMNGERLSQLVSIEAAKLAAAVVILSPYLPLLFMGEEYGETAPFPYFVSHSDPVLIDAVRDGRQKEFASFDWKGRPPDPQDPATFKAAKLNSHAFIDRADHQDILQFYRRLIHLRKKLAMQGLLTKKDMDVRVVSPGSVLCINRFHGESAVFMLFCFSDRFMTADIPLPSGTWQKALDGESRWMPDNLSDVPELLNSNGSVQLQLKAYTCVVFIKTQGAFL